MIRTIRHDTFAIAFRVTRPTLIAAVAALAFFTPNLDAQRRHAAARRRVGVPPSLHGSKESVEKMYDFAQRHRFTFYLSPVTLDAAIAQGRLVPLTGDSTYELTRGVGYSYATREAKQFVTLFAPQYLAACGTPLTVTSAARPTTRQPHNANPHSVHPTGIAVDFRRPSAGPCLTWVRGALADLEAKGIVEATEERHPVHLHVAVLVAPGARVALPDLTHGISVPRQVIAASTPQPTTPTQSVVNGALGTAAQSMPADAITPGSTYRVREGDTLWDVAQRAGVSVKALAAANHRGARGVLRPGTVLKIPAAK